MPYKEIATSKYASYPGNASLVFDAICKTLTKRASEVNWLKFTGDDWDLLTVMAKTEGVAPLLYEAFKGSNVKRLNVPTFNALQREYYATAAYNTLLFSELDRILTALNATGTCPEQSRRIPAILLKGAALALTIYPDPALRPMSDLDVLVPLEKTDHAIRVSNKLGYQLDVASAYWPRLKQMLATHHEHLRSQAGVNLELHWSLTRIVNAPGLTNRFWTHVTSLDEIARLPEPAQTQRPNAKTLSIEHHILFLSSHLFLQHGAARGLLLWLYDLHLILTAYEDEIDWDLIIAEAHQLRWSAAAATALEQLSATFQTKYPAQILEILRSDRDEESQHLINPVNHADRRPNIYESPLHLRHTPRSHQNGPRRPGTGQASRPHCLQSLRDHPTPRDARPGAGAFRDRARL